MPLKRTKSHGNDMTHWEVIIRVVDLEKPRHESVIAFTSKYLVSDRVVVRQDEREAIKRLVDRASKSLVPMALGID